MGQRIKRTVLTAAMLCLVGVALPATARAETSGTSTGLSASPGEGAQPQRQPVGHRGVQEPVRPRCPPMSPSGRSGRWR